MSETYMISAKTVEEAIAIANREYADENHEVSYEIVAMPKKGFLGIGAKDAMIKVTVTKSVSVELDSLVADIRGMKMFTAKGEKSEKSEKKNAQNQNSNRGQNAQNQNGNDRKKNDGKPKQNQNVQNAQNNQNAQKSQNNAKNDKPAQKNDGVKNQSQNSQQNQQKPGKPNAPKAQKTGDAQAKAAQAQENQKNEAAPQTKPQPAQRKNENAPQPAPVTKEAKEAKETKVAPVDQKNEKASNAAQDSTAKTQPKSSLRNQAKPGKRQQAKHNPDEANIPSSAVTVSAPVGLADFVASETSSFGSGSGKDNASSGRMSNDIKKGKKKQSSAKRSDKGQSVIYEDRQSMTTRYDVAESDEDYMKLDTLEDRELTIDEIRASVKSVKQSAAENDTSEKTDKTEKNAPADKIEIPASKPEKLRREAVTENEMSFALDFANTLLRNMGIDASAVPAECPEGEEFDVTEEASVYPKINIIGDDTGILIGHHGETLDAIQYLVNLSALRKSKQKDGDYVKIVVDIENYREKREETLRALARRMAGRALKYKRNVFLEPMNAYERRIIHSELQSVENVSTHSVGTDRDRKIIITYEGADKAPDNKNRRRRNNSGNKNSGAERTADKSANTAADKTAETAADDGGENANANRERRRPRKVQKMPIEKIGDILPDSE